MERRKRLEKKGMEGGERWRADAEDGDGAPAHGGNSNTDGRLRRRHDTVWWRGATALAWTSNDPTMAIGAESGRRSTSGDRARERRCAAGLADGGSRLQRSGAAARPRTMAASERGNGEEAPQQQRAAIRRATDDSSGERESERWTTEARCCATVARQMTATTAWPMTAPAREGLTAERRARRNTPAWRNCERKWVLPMKGSWGYGNQVKGSGAFTERILGAKLQRRRQELTQTTPDQPVDDEAMYYKVAGKCPKGCVYSLRSSGRKKRRYVDPDASTSQLPQGVVGGGAGDGAGPVVIFSFRSFGEPI
ncbi:hypothetical protein Scep_021739 [Stephania cephalantha]|uniref:Uncharacterized protein n=1 Tax=Stephania cephalantha TaxID=152367 RepID=A0AAP0I1P8_9MAGN